MKQETSENERHGARKRRQPYESPDFAWEAQIAEPEDAHLDRR
jgi:hypothetical protein